MPRRKKPKVCLDDFEIGKNWSHKWFVKHKLSRLFLRKDGTFYITVSHREGGGLAGNWASKEAAILCLEKAIASGADPTVCANP